MTVTLPTLAEYMGITAADSRYPQLQGVLDATTEHVARLVGPDGSGAFVVRPSGASLILPATRLVSVDTITDPTGAAVVVADCDVNLAAGVVGLPSVTAPGGYTVTVTTSASFAVDEATLIIAKHLWETRRGRMGREGAFAQPEEQVPMGFAIPRRAAELLAPLTVPGFA